MRRLKYPDCRDTSVAIFISLRLAKKSYASHTHICQRNVTVDVICDQYHLRAPRMRRRSGCSQLRNALNLHQQQPLPQFSGLPDVHCARQAGFRCVRLRDV